MERPDELARAERDLRQAKRVLTYPGNYDPDEWMLIATLVGEADLIVREGRASSKLQLLLEEVVSEFRELTKDFTDLAFLRASRAARRRNKGLFSARA